MPTANTSYRALANRLEGQVFQTFLSTNPNAQLGGPRGITDASTWTKSKNGLGLFYVNGVTQDAVPGAPSPVPAPVPGGDTFAGGNIVGGPGGFAVANIDGVWGERTIIFPGANGSLRCLLQYEGNVFAGGTSENLAVISTYSNGSWSAPLNILPLDSTVRFLILSGTSIVAIGFQYSAEYSNGSWSAPTALPFDMLKIILFGTGLVGFGYNNGQASTYSNGIWGEPVTVFPEETQVIAAVTVPITAQGGILAIGQSDSGVTYVARYTESWITEPESQAANVTCIVFTGTSVFLGFADGTVTDSQVGVPVTVFYSAQVINFVSFGTNVMAFGTNGIDDVFASEYSNGSWSTPVTLYTGGYPVIKSSGTSLLIAANTSSGTPISVSYSNGSWSVPAAFDFTGNIMAIA